MSLRLCTRLLRLRVPVRGFQTGSVLNNGAKSSTGLTAQVFPLNKETINESDVDEWLAALKKLRANGVDSHVETEAEVYLSTLANPEPYLERDFEPTEEQMAQVAAFANKGVPLQKDEAVTGLTNFIMRHGKKAKAEKTVSRALYLIYLKTRADPVEVLHSTLDKLGPLVTTRTELTGTAKNKIVPVPLTKKQRDRFAFKWILEASKNKKSPELAVRLAEEIIAANEGKSAGYDKKAQMHKTATSNRANLRL